MKHRDVHHFAKHHNVSVGLISAAEGLFSLVSVVVHWHPGVVDRHEVAVLACRQIRYSYIWQLHHFHISSTWRIKLTNQLLGGLHRSPSPSYMFPQSRQNRCNIFWEKHHHLKYKSAPRPACIRSRYKYSQDLSMSHPQSSPYWQNTVSPKQWHNDS